MENNEYLYRYVIAVNSILSAAQDGDMDDASFVKHAVTCCKEAKELNLTVGEQVGEIKQLIFDLELLRDKKLKELGKELFPFEDGEHVIVEDTWSRSNGEEGVFRGTKIEYDHIVPIVHKIKKDGTESARKILTFQNTKLHRK